MKAQSLVDTLNDWNRCFGDGHCLVLSQTEAFQHVIHLMELGHICRTAQAHPTRRACAARHVRISYLTHTCCCPARLPARGPWLRGGGLCGCGRLCLLQEEHFLLLQRSEAPLECSAAPLECSEARLERDALRVPHCELLDLILYLLDILLHLIEFRLHGRGGGLQHQRWTILGTSVREVRVSTHPVYLPLFRQLSHAHLSPCV
mmetsp:Transcript_20837/g.52991  ORF Transcript_20837/g.52991 Transcript_20837/m.52991 type:complete len:204 (-) Transcript_20837:84-695(-)